MLIFNKKNLLSFFFIFSIEASYPQETDKKKGEELEEGGT